MSIEAADNLRAAEALLSALMGLGLKRAVLCPGSRSGPLALAASRLESQGLSLLTGIDERSSAFFALGQTRADGQPTAVITTSGTAVANLLPAAVEADFSALPLLLLTADRPERLKACGANQTVNQEAYLQPACRALLQGPAAGLHEASGERLLRLAQSAMRHALGAPAGPVHLNLAFDEPLHADLSGLTAAAPPSAQELPALFEPPGLQSLDPLDPDQPGGGIGQDRPAGAPVELLQRRHKTAAMASAPWAHHNHPGLIGIQGIQALQPWRFKQRRKLLR